MNKLEVNQVGGFPMTTRILDEIQKAHAIFNALGAIVGDGTIISGCTVIGTTVSDGVVYVNGEVFEFRGGNAQTKVIIKEEVENLVFQNNTANPVIKTRYVTFGTGVGAMDWASFKRGFATKDIVAALVGKTDQSLFNALADAFALVYTKMLTIQEGADKSLNPDFAQTDPNKLDFIKNQPKTISYLTKGVHQVGDNVNVDSIQTVTFPSVGTNNYMVVGCMISNGSNYDNDNDVIWMIREKTNFSFKITLREVAGRVQNLSFEYLLIPI